MRGRPAGVYPAWMGDTPLTLGSFCAKRGLGLNPFPKCVGQTRYSLAVGMLVVEVTLAPAVCA
jgi:hypothetical protein